MALRHRGDDSSGAGVFADEPRSETTMTLT